MIPTFSNFLWYNRKALNPVRFFDEHVISAKLYDMSYALYNSHYTQIILYHS